MKSIKCSEKCRKVNLIPVDEWKKKIKEEEAGDKKRFSFERHVEWLFLRICNALADWADLYKKFRESGKIGFQKVSTAQTLDFSNPPFIFLTSLTALYLMNFLWWVSQFKNANKIVLWINMESSQP